MKRRNDSFVYISVILITLLLLSMLSVYASATYKSKKSTGFAERISAKASALYEPEEGQFIYEKNGDQRMPMASTTKIMTAIVVAKHCETDEVVIIGPESVGIEGSSAYLREGDEYTVLELLYALLLQSANDAATALAYYTAGGIEEFAELMNEEATTLKLENTHFTNPHGLIDSEHYTTAYDMALLTRYAIRNEDFVRIFSTITYEMEPTNKQPEQRIRRRHPPPFIPEAAADDIHRPCPSIRLAIPHRKQSLCILDPHPQKRADPHPQHRSRPADGDGSRDTGDVPRPHGGRESRAQRPEPRIPILQLAPERPESRREQPNLDKSRPDRQQKPCSQNQPQHRHAPQKSIDPLQHMPSPKKEKQPHSRLLS